MSVILWVRLVSGRSEEGWHEPVSLPRVKGMILANLPIIWYVIWGDVSFTLGKIFDVFRGRKESDCVVSDMDRAWLLVMGHIAASTVLLISNYYMKIDEVM